MRLWVFQNERDAKGEVGLARAKRRFLYTTELWTCVQVIARFLWVSLVL